MILTVSEADHPISPHVIVTLGVNEIKFCGQTIPVTIIVHQLHDGIYPIFPLKVLEDTNQLSPTNEALPYMHCVFPVLI